MTLPLCLTGNVPYRAAGTFRSPSGKAIGNTFLMAFVLLGLVIAGLAVSASSAVATESPAAAGEQGLAPWQAADAIDSALGRVEVALLFGEEASADIAEARRLLESGALAEGLAAADADLPKQAKRQLLLAAGALEGGDEAGLAAARASLQALLRRAAYLSVVEATAAGDGDTAREWLQIRDYRQSTRFTRPGTGATAAVNALAAGELTPDEAVDEVRKDLLDTYQSRLGGVLREGDEAAANGFKVRMAEIAALAEGYWAIIAPELREQRGADALKEADAIFTELTGAAVAGEAETFDAAVDKAQELLDSFTAAPFTEADQARRAAQFTRFLDLIPYEYGRAGIRNGHVSIPFEIQEAVAFQQGAAQALSDLKPVLRELEGGPEAVESLAADIEQLGAYVNDANTGANVIEPEEVEAVHERAAATVESLFPASWSDAGDEADFDMIALSLDQFFAAVKAGQWPQAQQAQLSAYAFFEFGPEQKLRAFDPGLAVEIEGLFWYGSRGVRGLADLVSSKAPPREVQLTMVELDTAMAEAAKRTGDDISSGTVIVNAALIVFREGLEAILIVAAITASMIGVREALRRPVYRGALLALPASVVAFILATALLGELQQYGEKVEAIVGILAVGVLLIVLNWFFHRVYWTEWIAGHRQRGKELTTAVVDGAAAGAGTVAGLYLLGFTSVFREGMETVLFLQSLQLAAGVGVVVAGVLLGLAATAAVGLMTFVFQRKLPYKRMLIVTGVLIALVLFVMVGNTVRSMQGVGWMPVTTIDIDIPLWAGVWLGIYPTVETLGFQALALVFVIGSYYLAEWVKKRPQRLAAARQSNS